MNSEILKEEEIKLKEVVRKISEEEENLEEDLRNSSMNYDLENLAHGEIVKAKIKKLEECEAIEKQIKKLRDDVKLIRGKDSEYNSGISIVPSYLAKGLEFDCVIIANASDEKYEKNSLDIKLLYVTITRAMSKLDIFYIGNMSKLLK